METALAFLLIIALFCGTIYFYVITPIQQKRQWKENDRKFRDVADPLISQMKASYNRIAMTISIPPDRVIIGMDATVFGMACEAKASTGFYIWFDKEHLYIFPTEEHYSDTNIGSKAYRTIDNRWQYVQDAINPTDIHLICIRFDDIEYYISQGEIETELHIVGGGGGGSSLSGAVVGGLLGGEVGAIIGSRKEVQKVSSYTTEKDKRLITVIYKTAGKTESLKLSATAYAELLRHIPEKDYNYIKAMQNRYVPEKANKSVPVSVADEIQKFADLRDRGIISEEEFTDKKKKLLNL